MKVTVSDFELRLIPFLKKVADTMPTSLHRWIGGAMVASSAKRIEGLLAGFADKDGMIDLDDVKKIVQSGFASSGGEVVIPFGNDTLNTFGLKTVNVKLTQTDADEFFKTFG